MVVQLNKQQYLIWDRISEFQKERPNEVLEWTQTQPSKDDLMTGQKGQYKV